MAQYGRNRLPKKEPPSLLEVFIHQLRSPLIYILLLAGLISAFIGEIADAIFILAVVLLNSVIGAFQEYRSERSAASLQSLIRDRAKIRRGAREGEIDAEDLVPGDIVFVESGQRLPADLRLLETNNLQIDESLLTGESTGVMKTTPPIADKTLPASDRVNLAFAGSAVISGRGMGVVVGTALNTELGKISKAVTQGEASQPPLVQRMQRFVKYISLIVLGAVGLLASIQLFQGLPFSEVFVTAVALAVAAIPEGLPVAMTVALAIGVNRMAKRNVIVRKLPAVEGLGSCTYIASDKTGTLTINRQTARAVSAFIRDRFERLSFLSEGDHRAPKTDVGQQVLGDLLRASVLANEATLKQDGAEWKPQGDSVDVAFLALAMRSGMSPEEIRGSVRLGARIPYESANKFSAQYFEQNGKAMVAAKGATETILELCGELDRDKVINEEDSLAGQGFRVIAVAQKELPQLVENSDRADHKLSGMALLGLVGFIDPLRPEAKEAVRRCQSAGVMVGMITGDHPGTALAIARDLGIAMTEQDLVTGVEIANHSEKMASARVFARVSPIQKVEIVSALVKSGHFVAVTGDGVNDAPALRKANIGVAMGSGTDVTKDTASIIVTDDNFASIEAGIEEGRYAYDNVRKVIYLLIATGAGEVVLFALTLLIGLPIPLKAAQLLWLNLVTNGIQDVALAFEKGEKGAMERPPRRPTEGIFDRLMIRQTLNSGAVIGVVSAATWWWMMEKGWSESSARNLLLLLMVLFENIHAFNSRSERTSVFRVPLKNNPILVVGVMGALALHLASLYAPFLSGVLETQPVFASEFLVLLGLAILLLISSEVFKGIVRRQDRQASQMERYQNATTDTKDRSSL